MLNLKESFFEFFDRYDKLVDINKNAEGHGLLERYHRMLGEDADQKLMPKIGDVVPTTMAPDEALVEFLPYLEEMWGSVAKTSGSIDLRRKLLRYTGFLTKIKGTVRSYEVLFRLLGFTGITLTVDPAVGGFDNGVGFDHDTRRFDSGSKCKGCQTYIMELTTEDGFVMTDEMFGMVLAGIAFVEPIDMRLRLLVLNGDATGYVPMLVGINDNGELYYAPLVGNAATLSMDAQGVLSVQGANETHYGLNEQGEVTYS